MRAIELRWLAMIVLTFAVGGAARADTVTFSVHGTTRTVRDVIFVAQDTEHLEYMELGSAGELRRTTFWTEAHELTAITVARSTDAEQLKLLEDWSRRSTTALVRRKLGPALRLCAVGMRYPLSTSVRYLMGSPEVKTGTLFYAGTSSADATQVHLREVRTLTVGKNGVHSTVTWRNGETTNLELLLRWDYDGSPGEPVVLFGLELESGRYFECPLTDVVELACDTGAPVVCSGNAEHRFSAARPGWQFCPLCGKRLVEPTPSRVGNPT